MSTPSRRFSPRVPGVNPAWSPAQSGTASGKRKKLKTSCFNADVQNVQPITTESLGVVGVEVLPTIPEKARFLAGPFYPDELEQLRDMLRGVRERSNVAVAPSVHQDALAIYLTL
jgi:hypothetical protein